MPLIRKPVITWRGIVVPSGATFGLFIGAWYYESTLPVGTWYPEDLLAFLCGYAGLNGAITDDGQLKFWGPTSWQINIGTIPGAPAAPYLGMAEPYPPDSNWESNGGDIDGFLNPSTGMYEGYAAYPPPCIFVPGVAVRRDGRETFERPGSAATVAQSGRLYHFVEGTLTRRKVELDYLRSPKVFQENETRPGGASLERLWREGYSRLRYYADSSLYVFDDAGFQEPGAFIEYGITDDALSKFKPVRRSGGAELYSYSLDLRRWVA